MDEVQRIAKEILAQFNLSQYNANYTLNADYTLIDNVVARVKNGDLSSAWWILEAFSKGWEYGSHAFKGPFDLLYQRYGEEKPSRQTELVRAIERLKLSIMGLIEKTLKTPREHSS